MSATRDKTQKVAFVYTNFHQLFKKGQEAAKSSNVPSSGPVAIPSRKIPNPIPQVPQERPARSHVIKAAEVAQAGKPQSAPKIEEYRAPELIGKRVIRPNIIAPQAPKALPNAAQNPALESLKENLKTLNSLHGRLRFMLQELEDLIKDED